MLILFRPRALFLIFLLCFTSDMRGQGSIIKEVIDAVDMALVAIDYDSLQPEQCGILIENVEVLRASLLASLDLNARVAKVDEQKGGLRFLAHGQQDHIDKPISLPVESSELELALERVMQVVHFPDEGLAETLDRELDDTVRTDQILEPFNRLQIEQLTESMARNQEVLNRYSKKFGPGSVQLNPLETLLNYAFQSVPGFGPDKLGSPGALELIAAYNTGYLSYSGDGEDFNVISAAEVGMRYYFLQDGWGEGSPLTPRYASFGLLISGQDDGALVLPWQGSSSRLGAFLSWGDYKFAYLGGDQSRFLFTRQFQIFDHVF